MLTTWSYHVPGSFTVVVTADDIELAKEHIHKHLHIHGIPHKPIQNIDLIPLPTHHRYARVFNHEPLP